MKKTVITLSIILAVMTSIIAETNRINGPVRPNPSEFARLLVVSFGGQDKVLDEIEVLNVLKFLQAHLPEQTTPGGFTQHLNRDFNYRNSARGDMTEERHALREYPPEQYVGQFIKRYDLNKDNIITRQELTPAMVKIIGLPAPKRDWGKRPIANR